MAAASLSAARPVLLATAAVGRTLPSMAVLALLLPFLGVGAAPAITALALLALPPVISNVDLAIRGVPPALVDAARGLGMTRPQIFARVVVPQALPVALNGTRIATTEIIASATLATFVGAGGLGDDIVRGMQTGDASVLIAASALVAILAFAADAALAAAARTLENR